MPLFGGDAPPRREQAPSPPPPAAPAGVTYPPPLTGGAGFGGGPVSGAESTEHARQRNDSSTELHESARAEGPARVRWACLSNGAGGAPQRPHAPSTP